MADGTWQMRTWPALATNLVASLPTSPGEVASIFWSGALAGFCLEAAVHGSQALHSRYEQLRRGHPLGTLGIRWWAAALRTPTRPRGPYQGAVGTLAAGTLWSGIFGSVYVPTRAAVDATVPPEQTAWGPAAAAAAGSIAASSVRVPLQVVKSRMQAHEFFCSLQAFELILRREGPGALYRGWVRSVSKNAPFDAVLFLLYDIGKTRVMRHNRDTAAAAAAAAAADADAASSSGAKVVIEAGGPASGHHTAVSGVAMAAWMPSSSSAPGTDDCGSSSSSISSSSSSSSSSNGGGDGCSSEAELYRARDAALVGGLAGALTGLLTSPPDLLRLRRQLLRQQQQQQQQQVAAAGAGLAGAVAASTPYASPSSSAAAAGTASSVSAAHHAATGSAGRGAAAAVEAAAAAEQRAALKAALRSSLRTRVLWAALEGAVFFSALETLIPICDHVFLPEEVDSQQRGVADPGAGGGGGGGGSAGVGGFGLPEAAGLLGGGSPLRHPAHPLHW
ncbi:hypothetical protein HYH02_013745 [Chlamydomonas schloesseri]|uniref:Mitochondrial carrier protein n=1 Tax=Chlamydomonas schloesseri TaxID=2026947 RepID=A0A835SV47_9CHLO|nr:hypothetical protein HYH02_013745 [Chlamydomonas schloesseri]|eukprot:KAG2430383.1 hypothetical protein HYH02_013745 [Chlamydomonas schloesseri]